MFPIRRLLALAAALLVSSCNQSDGKKADPENPPPSTSRLSAEPDNATPQLEATLNGQPWIATTIHYHVDHAFDAKEYAHTIEARAADGSKLDMVILCTELTLSPRGYPTNKDEELNITYTPAGRSAGSFAADSARDAQITLSSERHTSSIAGSFSATLHDLNPNGGAMALKGTLRGIPRARP